MTVSRRDRFVGCLLGGAVGDALGAPVEFMRRPEIVRRFGADGITAYSPAYGRLGAITDDTQMTLFTAEGLLRGWVRGAERGIVDYPGVVAHAYLRWLRTQGIPAEHPGVADAGGWLIEQPDLHYQRAPGQTCVRALRSMRTFGEVAENGSKGCGGVMRMAPAGLFAARAGLSIESTFRLGVDLAALTHGHPTGQLTAGVLSVAVAELCRGATIPVALDVATSALLPADAHDEALDALQQARALAQAGLPHHEAIRRLGEGWIAEEALAIAVYSALVAGSFAEGVGVAVNHDGDSDSTGAIAGNLLGASLGVAAIPEPFLAPLELRSVIAALADDLDTFPDWPIGEHVHRPDAAVLRRYPGC